MTKRETLGDRLAQLRRERAAKLRRDIDQTDIAKAIGIGAKKQSYVSKWESGTIPKDDVLKKLAAYYGVTVGWLRYGEGEKYAPTKGGTKEAGLDAATDDRQTGTG